MTAEGMIEVLCRDCGESLGYQSDAAPIDYALWQHNRCPARIAGVFGIRRSQYDYLLDVLSRSIRNSYPEFPRNMIGDPADREMQELRAGIAAGYAMDVLAQLGYVIRPA